MIHRLSFDGNQNLWQSKIVWVCFTFCIWLFRHMWIKEFMNSKIYDFYATLYIYLYYFIIFYLVSPCTKQCNMKQILIVLIFLLLCVMNIYVLQKITKLMFFFLFLFLKKKGHNIWKFGNRFFSSSKSCTQIFILREITKKHKDV